jgi:hypothetical protein
MKKLNKITNGKTIIIIGVIHTVLTPIYYAKQFQNFTCQCFFKINNGFMETQMNYETFAAFWCLFFGLILFPLGILLNSIENRNLQIPGSFILSYLIVILLGSYMIPLGGMTIFMLPHVVYMLIKNRKRNIVLNSENKNI